MHKIAILFPGQGSQKVGMGADCLSEPTFAEFIDRADKTLGYSLSSLMLQGPEEKLTLTENAQPAIFTMSYALFELMKGKIDLNDIVGAGHSLGEYTAVSSAGAIEFEDGVKLVHLRGKFMQEAVPEGKGAMSAIMAEVNLVESEIKEFEGVWIANINSNDQVVISGIKEKVDLFCERMRKKGIRSVPLRVSAPFHCPLMEPAKQNLKKFIENIKTYNLKFPVISAHTLTFYDENNVKDTLLYGITEKVNFSGCIKKLWDMGVKTFIEVGPGKVLSSLTKRIVPEAKIINVSSIKDINDMLSKI